MAYAVLLMIGGAVFVNGLNLLGYVQGNGAAIYNVFVGILGTAAPFVLLTQLSSSGASSFDAVLGVAPMWLFALTFLWVGINSLTGHTSSGVGWYCLWVAVLAVVLGFINIVRFGAPVEGIIWFNWAYLWGLFWLVLALGKTRLVNFTGWAAVLMAIWSVCLQALLALLGSWSTVPTWAAIGASVVTVVVALALGRVRHPDPEREDNQRTDSMIDASPPARAGTA